MPDHRVTTASGRVLTVSEGGDPNGAPIVTHAGTPASRLIYPKHDAIAREQGIRLIGYDRPGYGDSDRHSGRSVVDCVDDVHAIADALGLERFASWGISGGGPHVLACAARCDQRLVAVASLAAVAPYEADGLDWLAGMGQDNIDEFGAVLAGPEELQAYLEDARAQHLEATAEGMVEVLASLLGAADRSVLNGDFAQLMLDSSRLGLRDGVDGWFDDDVAFLEPWGFDLAQIDRPVLLYHGDDDLFVPVAHGRWLAERIPGVEARIDAADGHLTLYERRVREAHEWLLARL
ncbi:MAG TPA: alpha/beta hydrolase [Gaiellaceae bacterium]|nr:alpha/beta hydrolase [Gaiellaceae bacterium]